MVRRIRDFPGCNYAENCKAKKPANSKLRMNSKDFDYNQCLYYDKRSAKWQRSYSY